MASSQVQMISAQSLRDLLLKTGELALLDVREELTFSQNHILYASCAPLSRLERMVPRLVPRRRAPIVVCDGGGEDGGPAGLMSLARRAAKRLIALGYEDVSVLDGGTLGWRNAGYELFSG